eukprot:3931756-Rhodomonas_salina.2
MDCMTRLFSLSGAAPLQHVRSLPFPPLSEELLMETSVGEPHFSDVWLRDLVDEIGCPVVRVSIYPFAPRALQASWC